MLNRSLIAIVVSTAAPLSAPVIAHAQGAQTVDTIANAIAPPRNRPRRGQRRELLLRDPRQGRAAAAAARRARFDRHVRADPAILARRPRR